MTERRQGYSALRYFRCQSCGYNGPITEAEIAKHRSRCATGTTEPIATGVQLIAAERQRQVEAEGWTPEHDDKHNEGELIKAAVAYADCDPIMRRRHESFVVKDVRQNCTIYVAPWPWGEEWDKRRKHDRQRRLVIAGALIAAEIDRLQRLEGSKP